MLEINEFDASRPDNARTPGSGQGAGGGDRRAGGLLALAGLGAGPSGLPQPMPMLIPIETPLVLSGFTESALAEFGPMFQQMGVAAVQGGAAATMRSSKPVAGWERALNPGETIAGALVTGDMSVSGLGTVTYNDGKKVLGFGHPFFNLGPVDIPMAKGEVLMTLASSYQPNKLANATDVVGALRQDRHNGIQGALGEQSPMIPVSVTVRSLDDKEAVTRRKDLHFDVFVHQKWTPYLMMLTLYNSVSELNEFADETTYRLSAKVEMGGPRSVTLSNMQTSGEMPMPAPADAGELVRRQVQPPVPEQREDAGREARGRDRGPAARSGAWRPSKTPGWRTPTCSPATWFRSRCFCGRTAASPSSAMSRCAFPRAWPRATTACC